MRLPGAYRPELSRFRAGFAHTLAALWAIGHAFASKAKNTWRAAGRSAWLTRRNLIVLAVALNVLVGFRGIVRRPTHAEESLQRFDVNDARRSQVTSWELDAPSTKRAKKETPKAPPGDYGGGGGGGEVRRGEEQDKQHSTTASAPATQTNVHHPPARAPSKPGKHRDPYDINQAADEAVLDHLVFGEMVPKVYTKSALEYKPSSGSEGLDYVTQVRVPRGVEDLAAEDEAGEDGESNGGPTTQARSGGGGGRTLTYRVSSAIRRNLPSSEPSPQLRSCAVVGNSGTLLRKTLGSEIDSHDLVLRINNAPLSRKYEAHVGRKTHLSIINQHHAKDIANGREPLREGNATLVVYESTHSHVRLHVFPALMRKLPLHEPSEEAMTNDPTLEYLGSIAKYPAVMLHPNFIVRGYATYQGLRALVEEEETEMRKERARERAVKDAANATDAAARAAAAMAEVADRKYRRKPMTGFFAVLLTLQWCDITYVYGMSPWKYEHDWWKRGKAPYHYFDAVMGSTSVHSFDMALAAFKLISNKARRDGKGKPLIIRGG